MTYTLVYFVYFFGLKAQVVTGTVAGFRSADSCKLSMNILRDVIVTGRLDVERGFEGVCLPVK